MNIHDRMIIFLVLALFLGATMEYRHGSKLLGISLIASATHMVALMTRYSPITKLKCNSDF